MIHHLCLFQNSESFARINPHVDASVRIFIPQRCRIPSARQITGARDVPMIVGSVIRLATICCVPSRCWCRGKKISWVLAVVFHHVPDSTYIAICLVWMLLLFYWWVPILFWFPLHRMHVFKYGILPESITFSGEGLVEHQWFSPAPLTKQLMIALTWNDPWSCKLLLNSSNMFQLSCTLWTPVDWSEKCSRREPPDGHKS